MVDHIPTHKPLRPLPYASLPEIRAAIQRRRLVRFHHKGCEIIAQPHLLGKGARTGAYYLKCLHSEGEGEGQWIHYRFCEIRGLGELKDTFPPRTDVWAKERKIVELDTQARW